MSGSVNTAGQTTKPEREHQSGFATVRLTLPQLQRCRASWVGLSGINPGLTGDQSSAIAQLTALGSKEIQFAPQIGNVASGLLSGGNAGAQSGKINDAYSDYQTQLSARSYKRAIWIRAILRDLAMPWMPPKPILPIASTHRSQEPDAIFPA